MAKKTERPKQVNKDTPMLRQWRRFREKLDDDTLLLFRLGDFYELFFEDAERGARVLGITLTQRQGMPMAGIPYHARNTYLPRLLSAGCKVAFVDQMETPQTGKLVERELTRILTPGTQLEDAQLDARHNHYLLALDYNGKGLHAAWLELSTGEFRIATTERGETLLPLLNALDAQEVLLPDTRAAQWNAPPSETNGQPEWLRELLYSIGKRPVTELDDFHFDTAAGAREVRETLRVHNLEGFGLGNLHPALGPAGALLHYASENLCEHPRNIRSISEYTVTGSLLLDPATAVNLEIFRSAQGTREGSLLAAIDQTVTAAGARQVERWLASPTRDAAEIRRRQQAVREFLEEPGLTGKLTHALKRIRDVPRMLGRLQNRIRNPRELGGLRETLQALPTILDVLEAYPESGVRAIRRRIHDFTTLREFLDSALADELPGNLNDGGVIRGGFDAELDALRSATRENQEWIAEYETEEQENTGIKNLKVKYNGAFGYFIEVTKTNLPLVPLHYTRRQTMTNAERFTTDVLKAREKLILNADEKALTREEALFGQLIERVLQEADALRLSADALAEIDACAGWAQLARQWDYAQPEITEDDSLEIVQGRHPVVEQVLRAGGDGSGSQAFIPNDTCLSSGEEQIALITGPNMAGKSTYIRQVALIVLLAQIGCWVPARECRLGLVDRIFSRVGASDELARGKSTFMVEMNETANILNNATDQSLVILDEVGRGTSTYDGLSIAWAVVEHLHNGPDAEGAAPAGPKTLFATHYHELTKLEMSLPRVRNYCVAVKEWNDEIIFVRQVVPGGADRSYGIQVARLAGLPDTVIKRARDILEHLEDASGRPSAEPAKAKSPRSSKTDPETLKEPSSQLSLFS
ncbi:MAG: DNA mismatch repair protein MutS [Opitutales bacterium]